MIEDESVLSPPDQRSKRDNTMLRTALAIAAITASANAAAQQYFQASDGTVDFEKLPNADWTDPAIWDQITDTVAVTRKDTEGIFNPLIDEGFNIFAPTGTEWYFGGTVQDVINGTIVEDDFFEWKTAHGGNPPSTVGQDAVMFLIDENAYVDITFTSWGQGFFSGGGFAYTRAVVNITPADCPADVNNDGSATPADFTAWLGCFNNPASQPFCDRADVNDSGTIEPSDFTAWLAAFNQGCP